MSAFPDMLTSFLCHSACQGLEGVACTAVKVRTMWATMQAAEPRTRPLQNHLPLDTHLTTEAGRWMPQYLHDRLMMWCSAATSRLHDSSQCTTYSMHDSQRLLSAVLG